MSAALADIPEKHLPIFRKALEIADKSMYASQRADAFVMESKSGFCTTAGDGEVRESSLGAHPRRAAASIRRRFPSCRLILNENPPRGSSAAHLPEPQQYGGDSLR
jgi:hypothetical protein